MDHTIENEVNELENSPHQSVERQEFAASVTDAVKDKILPQFDNAQGELSIGSAGDKNLGHAVVNENGSVNNVDKQLLDSVTKHAVNNVDGSGTDCERGSTAEGVGRQAAESQTKQFPHTSTNNLLSAEHGEMREPRMSAENKSIQGSDKHTTSSVEDVEAGRNKTDRHGESLVVPQENESDIEPLSVCSKEKGPSVTDPDFKKTYDLQDKDPDRIFNPVKEVPVNKETDIQNPDERLINANEYSMNPDDSSMNPDEPLLNQYEPSVHLKEGSVNPDESSMNPDESSINPDESSINPDESSMNPDESSMNPDESSVNPFESSMNQDDSSVNPDDTSMNADDAVSAGVEDETSMNVSDVAEDDSAMDRDVDENVASSSKQNGGEMGTLEDVEMAPNVEDSMDVVNLNDEDPFGATTEAEDKLREQEPMEVEDVAEESEKASEEQLNVLNSGDDKDKELNKVVESGGDDLSQNTEGREETSDKVTPNAEDSPQSSACVEEKQTKEQETENSVTETETVGNLENKTVSENSVTSGDVSIKDTVESKTSEDAIEKPPREGDKSDTAIQIVVEKGADEEICIVPDDMTRVLPGKTTEGQTSSGETSKNGAQESIEGTEEKSQTEPSDKTSEDDQVEKKKTLKETDKQLSVDSADGTDIIEATTSTTLEDTRPSRPQRQAAKRAETQIKELAKEDSNSNEAFEKDHGKVTEIEGSTQMCCQCCRVRLCKYQVTTGISTRHLCQEECVKAYHKELGIVVAAGVLSSSKSPPAERDRRAVARKCAQCSSNVTIDGKNLSWEAMDFCNEECLGTYQKALGSHCANCKGSVASVSLGKYCVRFGYDVKQFCCSVCLEEFKKGLKVCSYCQKDISSGAEGFLAPVGDKGQFKDFCTQACMEKYDQMSNNLPAPPVKHQCAVCNKINLVKVEVLLDSKIHKLCSEPCFAAFKFVNTITADKCDMCKKYFDKDKTENFSVFYDEQPHTFCCKTCMNVYILANRKIVPCNWCKVKKYNFDMIKRVQATGQITMMCSLNCLTLYQVSISAVSTRRMKCDYCNTFAQAQYHLTMSDATIRNFCTYQCVMQFQGQFPKSAPLTFNASDQPIPTGAPKRVLPRRSLPQNEPQNASAKVGSPVITGVGSLTSANGQAVGSPTGAITASSPAIQVNNSLSAASVTTATPTTTTAKVVYKTQTIVEPPPQKKLKNKGVMVRPLQHTKGVSCRPHPCNKEVQTDEIPAAKPTLIPVPVPIYVPVPMHMYSSPFPVPVPFPLPVPVPIFIPTTRNSANGIFKEIKKIQEKIPTDPFEAELLMMAEMVADAKKTENSDSESEDGAADPVADVAEVAGASSAAEADFSPEAVDTSNTFGEDMLQMALKMASELEEPAVDLEAALTPNTITPQAQPTMEQNDVATESEDDPEPVVPIPERVNNRGTRKRPVRGNRTSTSGPTPAKRGRRISNSVDIPLLPPPEPAQAPRIEAEKPDANMCLKYTFGVNAWKHWVQTKNAELEKASANNRKMKLFKPEILQLAADELNYSLCLFVKEVRKPNGSEYAPDTIYYLCLGIQQYLFENGRIDNIFTDSYYEKFTECLDEVAKKFATIDNDTQYIVTRVEEEHLWESKQLGAHSPHVLLSTLMFFNTKHFNLTTVEEHMQLSFSHIMKHWKRNPNQPGVTKVPGSSRNVLLRFYPPQSALEGNSKKKKVYEQQENEENPLRCPVKLYEFYLSKCPESVKTRNDVFYLLPERSCVPDSPVWYSTMALGKEPLLKMLHRVKMVKEINMALLQS